MMNSFSYDDALKLIPKARPRKFLESRCDPVLDHCIKLRKFHDEIEHLILLTANLNEVYDDSEREPILQSLPPIPEIPELIITVPDEKLKNLPLEEIELSDESIMKLVSKSIACVFLILGYTDMSSRLLQMLSKVIIDYVKSLIEKMVQLLPENGSISLDLLETALQSEGINGIGELYSFYTQRIVKFHDKFYQKCRKLSDDLRNNLKKPDVPPVENITESSVYELCSTDISKEEQNNEASSEDSTKYSLDSGMLAEDIFVRKKVKRKSVRFGPQTAICEISNNKKLLLTNIAVDEEKFPAEKSVYSESFTYLHSMLTDSTVSLKCKSFDSNLSKKQISTASKNSSQITGLFNNSFYYCDDEILSDSKSIICDVNKVPDKSAVCYPDYESSVQSSILVDAVKNPDINAHGSKLIDVSWDQDVNIVCDEEEATFDSELVGESLNLKIFESSELVGDASVPGEEKVLNKSAIGSESIDDSSDQGTNIVSIEEKDFGKIATNFELEQDAIIVTNKKKACCTNAVASKLTNELLNQDSNMVNEEEKDGYKDAIDFELIEVSAIQDTSVVPNEKKAFNKNAIDSEPWNQDVNTAGVKKKSFDKNAIGSKATDNLLNLDSNITLYKKRTLVNNVIDPESRTNLECVFPDNTDSSQCTKHISELSCELNSAVCKHITRKSVCHSTDKPLHNHKTVRKLADLKNFGSLSDNSTGPRKKKPKLMKHKKVFEKDTNMETVPTKMKDDIENFECSSSSLDCNINSTKNLRKESEENSFHHHHNPKTSLTFEDSSVTIWSGETINCIQDVSSSSENETEQIWISL